MKIQQTRGEAKMMRTSVDINKLNENQRKPMHVHDQMNIGGARRMIVRRPTEAIEQQNANLQKPHEHRTKQQTTIILRKQIRIHHSPREMLETEECGHFWQAPKGGHEYRELCISLFHDLHSDRFEHPSGIISLCATEKKKV